MTEPEILRSGILDRPGISHGFTTRSGGVSRAPFASLNLSPARGDDQRAVTRNRDRVRRALGFDALVFARQVHGRAVLRVDPSSRPPEEWGEGDALITDRRGVGLAAQTADCTPVLLVDPERPAVAAVHAGWRGAVQNVVGETIASLTSAYGSRPEDLLAAIGPSISKVHYRVGPEVLEAFRGVFGALDDGLIGGEDSEGGATLDVAEALRRQLVGAGVRPDRVERLACCTFADRRFFSSRRARRPAFGAQAGIVGLLDTRS